MSQQGTLSTSSIQQLQPPIIDSRPKHSAFTTQSNPSIVKPIAQPQQQQQQQQQNDKFAERLTAMLQSEGDRIEANIRAAMRTHSMIGQATGPDAPQISGANLNSRQMINNNRPMSAQATLSYNDLPDMNLDQMIVNNRMSSGGFSSIQNDNRPMSAMTQSLHAHQNGIVIHPSADLRAEINQLKVNNQQAHEKLRQLQLEQQQLVSMKASNDLLCSSSSNVVQNDDSSLKKKELLEKLKQEQNLLKEQINMLNKQRETAQQELEMMGVASGKNNPSGISHNTIKSLYDMNATPNLSPISTDNIFHHIKQ